MRLLYFIEPFPVRGRPLDFAWVFERWRALAEGLERRGVESTFVVPDALADHVAGATCRITSPGRRGFWPELPADAAALDAQWVQLMKDPHSRWRPFIEGLLDELRPDVVLSWTVNAALREAASERGIALLHQELGPVRLPGQTLFYCDPLGVNGASAMPHLWPSVRDQPLTLLQERELDLFVEEFLTPTSPTRAELAARLELSPGRPVLAVFLQVARDSNVIAWSRVAGNAGLLRVIGEAVDPAVHQVVVKVHPGDPVPPAELEALGFKQAPPELPSLSLLSVADAVCTINSSVGLEALARGKAVYAFGDGPFTGLGCTRDHGSDSATLRRSLLAEGLAQSPLERTAARRLLHFMFFRYLASDQDLCEPEAFLSRLHQARELVSTNAGWLDWFAPVSPQLRMRELRVCGALAASAAREQGLRQELQLTAARLRDATAQAAAQALAQAAAMQEREEREAGTRRELDQLRQSVGVRVLERVKRIPGLNAAYLLGKRLLG